MYSSDGQILAEFFIEKREVVPLSRVPPLLQKAFIAVEDRRFYKHPGIDVLRLTKALWTAFTT